MRESLARVGLSELKTTMGGSWNPFTTRRALAFQPVADCGSSFHVSIQREAKILLEWMRSLAMALTVLVSNQHFNSFCFAA